MHETPEVIILEAMHKYIKVAFWMRVLLETTTDAIQWVCVPHLCVPSLEPASEGWGLKALLYSDNRGATATRGVRIHIIFG